ncbi:DUF2911 domain-containing protein [Pedobacter antarcticus]|uniref:DUF2911 domain-containing protein n=1 Tax=Pedobacter antarcticus TaxID=34086 RepID=UPI00088E0CDF|nr:DUF2911 domain-containing protein [Pedobacter antarcticus]SDM48804.1 Protein of unknown function [Pedobacter antarcticus]
MKKLRLIVALAAIGFAANAQEVKFPPLDGSPADLAYFPVNAAKVKAGDNSTPQIRVIYSRPSVKGRKIFGETVPFGKVWRAGANESTEIRFYQPVTIGGKAVPAGSYSLFVLPEQDKWVFILNKQTDRWGEYTYDQAKDVVRVTVPVEQLATPVEALTIAFSPDAKGAKLHLAWDKLTATLPVTIR